MQDGETNRPFEFSNFSSNRLDFRSALVIEGFTLAEWMPPVDIEESDKEYLIKAELPGTKKEEVKIKVEGGTLSISGERKPEKDEKDKKCHRVERSYGASKLISRFRPLAPNRFASSKEQKLASLEQPGGSAPM